MKKLITLFSFLAFFSLIFIGCQSTENITAPEDLSKAPPVSFNWENPASADSVDLVAGQTHIVGYVKVEKVGNCGLKVTYSLTSPGKIDEVHVDLALNSNEFTVNKNGSPTFGNFDSKTYGATISGIGGSEVTVEFSCDQLMKALGVASMNGVTKIYIAAHSGVCMETGETTGATAEICPDLSGANGAKITGYKWISNYPSQLNYFMDITFDKAIVNGQSTFNGWCLDYGRSIPNISEIGALNFVCSYSYDMTNTCTIKHPENLNKANWIINHRDGYDAYAVTAALWELLSDQFTFNNGWKYTANPYYESNWQSLLSNLNTNYTDSWKPVCGDDVLVIVYRPSTDPCSNLLPQTIGIVVPVECMPVYKCDTAMGFNFPLDGTSAPFNHQWFRYFAFSY